MDRLPHPSHPADNGTRAVNLDRRPDTARSGSARPAPGGVSRLDRITLQLGVAVAVVIAMCSYAVSATSLYALGIQAGYSWWQAAAVPVVADGPAEASDAESLERLGEALETLAQVDPSLANLVDLHFFCGFPLVEIAGLRGVSERTVQRDWRKARLLLHRRLNAS